MCVNTTINSGTITGWSLHCSTSAKVYPVIATEDARKRLGRSAVIVRGSGQSFGDVSLPDQRVVLGISEDFEVSRFSLGIATGVLTCPAGMTQSQVLEKIVPSGWILPAIPGASQITMGGAVAADAHGKNHFANGSIADHLLALEIMIASGEVLTVSRENHSDIFWATIGGLGLTGIILEVTLQLNAINSSYAVQEVSGFEGVSEMLDLIEEKKDLNEFLIGTVEGGFCKRHQWSGVITTSTIPVAPSTGSINYRPRQRFLSIPNFVKHVPLRSLTTWGLNKAITFSTRRLRTGTTDLDQFLFPQDALENWNRLFGKCGFIDYQCCIPIDRCNLFFPVLHRFLNQNSIKCFLVVIKRFRMSCNQNPLVFAQNGISIALGMPIRPNTLRELLVLDEIVIGNGGRVNLVKDARLSRLSFNQMYPRKDEWLAIKRKYDPLGRFRSQLSTRLGLNIE